MVYTLTITLVVPLLLVSLYRGQTTVQQVGQRSSLFSTQCEPYKKKLPTSDKVEAHVNNRRRRLPRKRLSMPTCPESEEQVSQGLQIPVTTTTTVPAVSAWTTPKVSHHRSKNCTSTQRPRYRLSLHRRHKLPSLNNTRTIKYAVGVDRKRLPSISDDDDTDCDVEDEVDLWRGQSTALPNTVTNIIGITMSTGEIQDVTSTTTQGYNVTTAQLTTVIKAVTTSPTSTGSTEEDQVTKKIQGHGLSQEFVSLESDSENVAEVTDTVITPAVSRFHGNGIQDHDLRPGDILTTTSTFAPTLQHPRDYNYAQRKRRNRYKNRRPESDRLFGPVFPLGRKY